MASIHPIEASSIHKLQSGQVITDLCAATKELVENSLDAGATSIEVRFRNHGLDMIEVQDNGSGISPEDYDSIASKHHTSKLRTFDDLDSLNTFGFRGEALSSLCAVSDLHIVTARAESTPKGARLDFDVAGRLRGPAAVVAAQTGTTVAAANLFRTLPVRRQELERNIKREYGKVLSLLQAYACISKGIRFSVVSFSAANKRTTAFATKANLTTRENIANVFGAKTLSTLATLDLEFELPIRTSIVLSKATTTDSQVIRVEGHMSKPNWGEGRPLPDRQMFFVNARPCQLPQFSKVTNEVYRSYNMTQAPFVFANVSMSTNAYDVNVSPDKRTILIHDQPAFLEAFREALIGSLDSHRQTFAEAPLLPSHKNDRKSTPQISRSISTAQEQSHSPYDHTSLASSNPQLETLQSRSPSDQMQYRAHQASEDGRRGDTPLHKQIEQTNGHAAEMRDGIRNPDDVESLPGDVQEAAPKSGKLTSERDTNEPTNSGVVNTEGEKSNTPPEDELQSEEEPPASDARDANQADFQGNELEAGISQSSTIPSLRAFSHNFGAQRISSGASGSKLPARREPDIASVTIGDESFLATIGARNGAYSDNPIGRGNRRGPQQNGNSSGKGSAQSQLNFSASLRKFAASKPESQEVDESHDENDNESEVTSDADDVAPLSDSKREMRSGVSRSTSPISPVKAPLDELDRLQSSPSLGSSTDASLAEEKGEHSGSGLEESDDDGEYLDETAKKLREEARVAKLVEEAEVKASVPSEDSARRAQSLLKGGHRGATTRLVQSLDVSVDEIEAAVRMTQAAVDGQTQDHESRLADDREDSAVSAEDKLTLTVAKDDFLHMRIVGQFNLGFILAIRPAQSTSSASHRTDDLFIIDQHAADEKYNFERLQATTVLQNQRLVQPRVLDLTAVEEEIAMAHAETTLLRNGFVVQLRDEDGDITDQPDHEPVAVGRRCTLVALPASREVTFNTRDLEELLALLSTNDGAGTDLIDPQSSIGRRDARATPMLGTVVRPSKVRRLLAMRACRSSVMVGRALVSGQMQRLVRNMAGMDKPWNCPHGRPTMRHLKNLSLWQSWTEETGVSGMLDSTESPVPIDWTGWLAQDAQESEQSLDGPEPMDNASDEHDEDHDTVV